MVKIKYMYDYRYNKPIYYSTLFLFIYLFTPSNGNAVHTKTIK